MNHAGTRAYFIRLNNGIKPDVMSSTNDELVNIEISADGAQSPVAIMQVFLDKTETTLERTALVAYPDHATFINIVTSCRGQPVDKGLIAIVFFSL